MTAKEVRLISQSVKSQDLNISKLKTLIRKTIETIREAAFLGDESVEINFGADDSVLHDTLIQNLLDRGFVVDKVKGNKRAKVTISWRE